MANNNALLKSLSILMGLLFVFVGTLKLTPQWNEDFHNILRSEYVEFSKVIPLTAVFCANAPQNWYCQAIGILEVVCGLTLAVIPFHVAKNTANVLLLMLISFSVYQHWMLEKELDYNGPLMLFIFMLTGRLVIWYQTTQKQAITECDTQSQIYDLKEE